MSIIVLIAAFITISTLVALMLIPKSTPAPTVASMLRRKPLRGESR